MYFVLISFITNLMLPEASFTYITTTSITLTDCPSINTLSAYATYCLVLLKNFNHRYNHYVP